MYIPYVFIIIDANLTSEILSLYLNTSYIILHIPISTLC